MAINASLDEDAMPIYLAKLPSLILAFTDSFLTMLKKCFIAARRAGGGAEETATRAASYYDIYDKCYPGKDKHINRCLSSRQQKSNTDAACSLDRALNRQQLRRDVNNRSKFRTNSANLLVPHKCVMTGSEQGCRSNHSNGSCM